MEPKPVFLGPHVASAFQDSSVIEAYLRRPPYPEALFQKLAELMTGPARAVLDVGTGTGDVARRLAPYVERVDAVDWSAGMIALGKQLPGGDDPRIRWIQGRSEDVALDPPYSLVTAGESLHWMDWDRVLPRIAEALAPGAVLAIVEGRVVMDVPWAAALEDLFPRYSTNRDYRPYDLVVELAGRDLFREAGRRRTAAVAVAQSIDDYVESFHTRNGLSRERMGRAAAGEFDAVLRGLVEPHCGDGAVRGRVATRVVWGTPRS